MENLYFFLFFYLAFIIILNSLLIIFSNNPIHSIFFLILVFICSTILLLLLGVEFIAMLFLIIYIGAITVLFLFVIMMLNVKIIEFNEKFVMYLPIGIFLSLLFLIEIFYLIKNNLVTWDLYFFELSNRIKYLELLYDDNYIDTITILNNVQQLAVSLYSKFGYLFILSGIILLIAMLGAIVLTLNKHFKNKRQDYYIQNISNLKKAIRYII